MQSRTPSNPATLEVQGCPNFRGGFQYIGGSVHFHRIIFSLWATSSTLLGVLLSYDKYQC